MITRAAEGVRSTVRPLIQGAVLGAMVYFSMAFMRTEVRTGFPDEMLVVALAIPLRWPSRPVLGTTFCRCN